MSKRWGLTCYRLRVTKSTDQKGVGLLYVRSGLKLEAQSFGGEQERKRRAGTENVAGIVGFAEAVRLTAEEREQQTNHYRQLRTMLLARLEASTIDFESMERRIGASHQPVFPPCRD